MNYVYTNRAKELKGRSRWWSMVSSVGKSWVKIKFHPPFFHLTCIVTYWKLWIIMKLRVPSSLIQSIWKCCIKSRPTYDHLPLAEFPQTSFVIPMYFCVSEFQCGIIPLKSQCQVNLYVICLQDTMILVIPYSEWDNAWQFSWGYNNADHILKYSVMQCNSHWSFPFKMAIVVSLL